MLLILRRQAIVAPCPACQMDVEVYQDEINATYNTKIGVVAFIPRPVPSSGSLIP